MPKIDTSAWDAKMAKLRADLATIQQGGPIRPPGQGGTTGGTGGSLKVNVKTTIDRTRVSTQIDRANVSTGN